MSSKSAVKILAPADQQGALFRWVALLTGSKNAVKGVGFLLGAALLALVGLRGRGARHGGGAGLRSLWPSRSSCPPACRAAARARSSPRSSPRTAGSTGSRRRGCSCSAPAMSGSSSACRSISTSILSDGTPEGSRAAFFLVGGFMALWIIGYGAVQAAAPRLLRAKDKRVPEIVAAGSALGGHPGRDPGRPRAARARPGAGTPPPWLTGTLVLGLLAFGVVFALNSALHSYLILAFSICRARHHGRRLLLHGERRRPADRHACSPASASSSAACRSALRPPARWRR